MSYAGFGVQSTNSMRKPKKAFKPVFEQISTGEHPSESKNPNPLISWSSVRQHLDNEERGFADLSTKIYLVTIIGVLTALLVSMI